MSEKSSGSSSNVPIIVAVIGLLGVLGTALIGKWPDLFRREPPPAVSDTVTPQTSTTGTTQTSTGNGPPQTTSPESRPGFRIVETFLRADPFDHTGPCPVTITFSGRISVAGGGGTVSYRFVRSDHASGPVHTLVFDGPGSKDVTETWTLGASGTTFSGWEAVKTLDPQEMESQHADFQIRCQ